MISLFGVNIPSSVADLKNTLALQIANTQAKVGTFLQQRQRIMILAQRASALSKTPQSASWSSTLITKSQDLLNAQSLLEKDSARFVQDANNTMTQLQTDPIWIQASQGLLPTISWDNVNKSKMMAETIVNVGQQLENTLKRIDTHISNVDDFENKVRTGESNSNMSPRLSMASAAPSNVSPWVWLGLGLGGLYLYKKRRA